MDSRRITVIRAGTGPFAALSRAAAGWRYVPGEGRDLRLDLLRGFLIFVMVTDHVGGGSWVHAITGGDKFVVSAAEGFIFLSGLLMGMIYRRIISREGLRAALRKVFQRGVKLYALHVILTLGFIAASKIAAVPWYTPVGDRLSYVVGLLTLRQTHYLTDIIQLYAVLVLVTPIALTLLARGHAVPLLLGSGALWAVYQQYPWELASLTGNMGFPAAAWQIFFFSGLAIGYHRSRVGAAMERIPRVVMLILLGIAAAAMIAQQISGGTLFLTDGVAGQSYEQLFFKWDVRPGRLLAAAVFFPLAYLLVTAAWKPIRAGLGWAFLPLGANALLAYSAHLFVLILAVSALPLVTGVQSDDPARNSAVQLAAVMLIWSVVMGKLALSAARSWEFAPHTLRAAVPVLLERLPAWDRAQPLRRRAVNRPGRWSR